jgi:serine/threonine protein kinase
VKGGFGRVFSVKENSEKYAIKVIAIFQDVDENLSAHTRQKYLDEVKKEAEFFQTVRHENIINYYDNFYIENEDRFVIKMELAEYDLKCYVERNINHSREEIRALFLQICNGVCYLHKKGLIHCDLKLSNILIKEGKAKICDFGGSKKITENSGKSKTLNLFMGTEDYLAPENFFVEEKKFIKETDIWALGIILYKLLITKLIHF